MFGYVRPLPDELKGKDLRLWQQDYCGLCRCLGRRYGLRSRFLLRYDMTFFYELLVMAERPGVVRRCWCPAGVVCRKPCRMADPAMEYTADLSVLLLYWKLRDEEQDGGFLRRTGARIVRAFFGRAYRKAAAAQPEMDGLIRTQLAALRELQLSRCDSIDRTADAFAAILRGFAAWWKAPEERRPAEQLLYHIGRYVYLVDALDDLPKDAAAGNYNPLCCRFTLRGGTLGEADRRYLLQVLDASIGQAAAAFELMRRGAHGAVPENIIYYGLPAVLKAVSEGTFNHRKRAQLKE